MLHFSIYSLGTRVSSTNKTDRHDITDILLKVLLNTITPSMYLFPWIMLIKLRLSKTYVFLFRVCPKSMYFFSEYVQNLCILCTSFLIYFKYNALNYANNRHDITEILLKVALNTINLTLNYANYTKVVQDKVLTLDYACYTVRKVQFYPCEWLPIY